MSLVQARQLSAPLRRARAGVLVLAGLFLVFTEGLSVPIRVAALALVIAGGAYPFFSPKLRDQPTAIADVAVAWLVWSLTGEPVVALLLVLWGVVSVAFEADRATGWAVVIAAGVGEALKVVAVLMGMDRHQILGEAPFTAGFGDLTIQAGIIGLLIVGTYLIMSRISDLHGQAVDRLTASADEHRDLINHAPVPVLALDDWRIDFCNSAAAEMLGMESPDELTATDVREFMSEDDAGRLRGALEASAEAIRVDDVVLIPASGAIRIVDIAMRPVTVSGAARVQMACTDVTKRAEVHLDVSEREELFRGAFVDSATPSGISTLDGTIVRANEAFTNLLGYSEDEVIGRSWSTFMVRSEWIEPAALVGQAGADGDPSPVSTEGRFEAKDGRLIPILASTSFIRDQHGEPFRVFTQFIDLSARVAAEEQVERRISQQQIVAHLGELALRSGIESLMDEAAEALSQHLGSFVTGVFLAQPDGALVLSAGTGWPAGSVSSYVVAPEASGQMDHLLLHDEPLIVGSLHEEQRYVPPEYLVTKGARASVGARIRGSGAALGVVAVWSNRDRSYSEDDVHFVEAVANLLAAAIERQTVMERLEELVTSKDQFLASVSHELRTPLTVVNGMAAELEEHWSQFSPEEVAEFVRLITDQSRDMAALIEDLLVAARADIGAVAVRAVPVDLRRELQAVLSTLPDIHLTRNDVRHLPVLGDATRLRQILRNLLTNAHRYGGPVIRAASTFDGEYVQLSIADNGDGIPPDLHAKIFEPYQRAHERAGVTGSVGLGLSVSRTLAELMGGSLSYRHSDGESIFDLTLPAASVPTVSNVVPLEEHRAIS